jgi:hypothetical protein
MAEVKRELELLSNEERKEESVVVELVERAREAVEDRRVWVSSGQGKERRKQVE